MARNAARSRLPTALGSLSQRLRIASDSAGRPRRQPLPGNWPRLACWPAAILGYPRPAALQGWAAGGLARSGGRVPHTATYGPGGPGGSFDGRLAGQPAVCSLTACVRCRPLGERPSSSCPAGTGFRPGPPACPASSPVAAQERCAPPPTASYGVVTGRAAGEPGVAGGTCHVMSAGPVSPAGLRGRRGYHAIRGPAAARPWPPDKPGDAAWQEGTLN